ncbi:MAG: YdcH family protein [Pseudomonadota bacterium]
MAHTPHELPAEFPEYVDQMHTLKTTNTHFLRLFDEYHQVNRSIHRAETNVEPTCDVEMLDMRRRRMTLKDEIYGMLRAQAVA